ncbi:winged helix-turn-helix transcriptional regulator [Alteriqipengyuania lutimaris]|uniref:Transcriptional regulator n=1 Tax=Alteriqipengyuania lutimaris TaxID=1538146 RepID=A0A395LJX4_9SPHN|nr:helix-turn-helix domain-containing protein [Alteriqipengyuania lutimaris]MBB3033708.1 DNA-binding HxlR family transcriptional regulator [Alteriqipengyuania lutimaris]RDS77306.1 transcriptional regulator [Alteriqipengyuania lutimaris]
MNAPARIRTCSIWRSLEVVGDTPSLLVIEASWLGERRFDGFRKRTGLLKALLSDRLKKLVAAGLFEKRKYCDTPERYEYVFTEKGRDVYWISLMMLRWETGWAKSGNIAVELTHKNCGKRFRPEPACGSCGEVVNAFEVDWREGPGVGLMAPIYSRRRRQRHSPETATTLMNEAAQLMGDRWASLIMRSIFTHLNRFDEIRQDTAIATNILSERLKWLESIGVIRQKPDPDSSSHTQYRLTRKGVEYYPVLLMLMIWGDRYYASPEGPPVVLFHKNCGQPLNPQVVCSECHEPIASTDVEFEIVGEAS